MYNSLISTQNMILVGGAHDMAVDCEEIYGLGIREVFPYEGSIPNTLKEGGTCMCEMKKDIHKYLIILMIWSTIKNVDKDS